MTDLGRRYLRSAIGVECGLLIGAASIGVLAHSEVDSLFGRSILSQGDTVANAAPPKAADSESVAMTPHAKPRPLPELHFTNADGRGLSLADFRGRLVLLNLWATWCVPCRKEMPTLDRLEAKFGGADFEIVALSIDRQGLAAVKPFFAELGIKALRIYIDQSGKTAFALNAPGLPTTLLIDRDGREIARKIGPAEWDSPGVERVIRRYLPRKAAGAPHTVRSNSANINTDEVAK